MLYTAKYSLISRVLCYVNAFRSSTQKCSASENLKAKLIGETNRTLRHALQREDAHELALRVVPDTAGDHAVAGRQQLLQLARFRGGVQAKNIAALELFP